MPFRLEIVTPEEKSYSDEVDGVVIPGVEGELGILPSHVPLMTMLHPGELRVTKDGVETRMAIGQGFVEITQDHVNILTDMAVEADNIDEAEAEEAVKRAEEALQEKFSSDEEQATVEASLQKSLARLRVKRRRHY